MPRKKAVDPAIKKLVTELKKASYFVLGKPGEPDDVSLLCCSIHDIKDTDCVHFSVINGAWDGIFLPAENRLFINYPVEPGLKKEYLPAELHWMGSIPVKGDYNVAIEWVKKEIQAARDTKDWA